MSEASTSIAYQELNNPPNYGATAPPQDDDVEKDSKLRQSLGIINQLKQAKKTIDSPTEFIKTAAAIILASSILGACLLVLSLIPVISVIIGSIYLNECPIERHIPVWLIVSGIFGLINALLKGFFNLFPTFRKMDENLNPTTFTKLLTSANGCISCFLFIWFIAGNIWVYGNFKTVQTTNSTAANYCNHYCYYYAFSLITVSWSIVGLSICCCAFICCFVFAFAVVDSKQTVNN